MRPLAPSIDEGILEHPFDRMDRSLLLLSEPTDPSGFIGHNRQMKQMGISRPRGNIKSGFVLGFLFAAIAKSRGMSSERFHKAYYRYTFYISIPAVLVIYIITSSTSEVPQLCATH